MTANSIRNGDVLRHFANWDIFGLGGIRTFSLKKSDRKLSQFIKILSYSKS